MDAIRKKMQSLKGETEQLYATIEGFEETTREANARADQVSHTLPAKSPVVCHSVGRL